MTLVQTTREALTTDGVVTRTDLALDPDTNTVVLTIGVSTDALADTLFDELAIALRAGECRLGNLVLSITPGTFVVEAS